MSSRTGTLQLEHVWKWHGGSRSRMLRWLSEKRQSDKIELNWTRLKSLQRVLRNRQRINIWPVTAWKGTLTIYFFWLLLDFFVFTSGKCATYRPTHNTWKYLKTAVHLIWGLCINTRGGKLVLVYDWGPVKTRGFAWIWMLAEKKLDISQHQ